MNARSRQMYADSNASIGLGRDTPFPPWILKGHGIQRIDLLDSAAACQSLPEGFAIANVMPGKTLGGLFIGRYGLGSTIEYSELIAFGGIARFQNQIGCWVTHIYVDSAESLA